MIDSEKLHAILSLVNDTSNCQCGFRESCDYCSPAMRRLEDKIRDIIQPKEPMTAEDYGRSIDMTEVIEVEPKYHILGDNAGWLTLSELKEKYF